MRNFIMFRAYTGTTLEAYRTCAVLLGNGSIVFDKSKEPELFCIETCYFPEDYKGGEGFAQAASYAFRNAQKLRWREKGHYQPLVLSGLLEDRWKQKITCRNFKGEDIENILPAGILFPVDKIFSLLNPETFEDIINLSYEQYPSYLQEKDPKEVLTFQTFWIKNIEFDFPQPNPTQIKNFKS